MLLNPQISKMTNAMKPVNQIATTKRIVRMKDYIYIDYMRKTLVSLFCLKAVNDRHIISLFLVISTNNQQTFYLLL